MVKHYVTFLLGQNIRTGIEALNGHAPAFLWVAVCKAALLIFNQKHRSYLDRS